MGCTMVCGCEGGNDGFGPGDVSDGDDAGGSGAQEITAGETYAFPSRLVEGGQAVSYSGQVARHVLIADWMNALGNLESHIANGNVSAESEEDVIANYVDFFLRFDSEAYGDLPHGIQTTATPKQTTYGALSTGKDLWAKLAGNDPVGDAASVDTLVGLPEAWTLAEWVTALSGRIGTAVLGRVGGDAQPDGMWVTEDGWELPVLLNASLACGIAYSQLVDDYLDEGLLKDNVNPDESGAPFTALGHAWDEGFGYFGAPASMGTYSLETLSGREGPSDQDVNGDGMIDLKTEVAFGWAVEAARRDLDSQTGTAFARTLFEAFHVGRQRILANAGALSGAEMKALEESRNTIYQTLEQVVGATVVHHLNALSAALEVSDAAAVNRPAIASHWSAAKGYALCFQFHPGTVSGKDELGSPLQTLLGQAPFADLDNLEAFRKRVSDARDAIGDQLNLAAEDLTTW